MIKRATLDDFADFFKIKSESDNLYWCGYKNKPDRNNLWMFWNKYVPYSPERTIYSIFIDRKWVGYIYVDYKFENGIGISIGVSSTISGQGIATSTLCELVNELRKSEDSDLIAYIREDNIRSQRVFAKVGFENTGTFHIKQLETEEKETRFFKWVYLGEKNAKGNW